MSKAILPSRMNLAVFKQKKVGAKKGYDLLKKKSDALKSAKFPISGLSFNDDGVLYKDIPFSQCSAAERLKVSLSIAMAMNPKVRVIRITDGSLLDDSNLKVISDMAKEKDFQIWLETIHSDDPLRVIIEDGEIKQKGVKDNEPEGK